MKIDHAQAGTLHPSDDAVDAMRHAERATFLAVRAALIELADHPIHDQVGLARARQRYANARDNWASSLRTLDQFEYVALANASGGR